MTETEEKKALAENEKPTYMMKGVPVNAYLIENGEFRWIPSTRACCSKENAKTILEVLRKMPPERRTVWIQRLDLEETKIACPVIREESDLCKEFDEFCAAYTKPPVKTAEEKKKEVNQPNE